MTKGVVFPSERQAGEEPASSEMYWDGNTLRRVRELLNFKLEERRYQQRP